MVDDVLEAQHSLQRATILRVYNYYRILISFLFLVLSLDPNFNAFVGKVNPELFRATSIGYLVLNLIAGLASFFVSARWLANTTPSFVILVLDIVFLTLLGGGAFGNRPDWIHSAVRRALEMMKPYALDVRLVSYGEPSRDLLSLVRELG